MMTSMKKYILVVGTIVLLVLIGLYAFRAADAPETGRVSVVATFYPLGHFAEKIGGDLVDVAIITPPGAEPHDYEPTPRDIADVYDADVFLLNGNGVDAWAERILPDVQARGVKTVRISDSMTSLEHSEGVAEEDEGPLDPHFWLDPVNAAEETMRIADALIAADPERRERYEASRDAYVSQLETLDTEFLNGLATCESREIVTSHDAFRYLAHRYGLTTVHISGLSPEEEPSPQTMADVANLARERGIDVIFFESLVSPKLAETIANEVGARTLPLNPLEGLTDDEINSGMDYVSVMRDNLEHLRDALACS